jgi:orotidine-5'-phosphate decarboxylase
VRGRGDSALKLLGVTVLTNLSAADLIEQGIDHPLTEVVLHRARLAREAGFDGVVASGHETTQIRSAAGPEFLVVTPGVRPQGSEAQDQARAVTPRAAIAAGASYLVVGRPITRAADPRAAADAIVGEIAEALAE